MRDEERGKPEPGLRQTEEPAGSPLKAETRRPIQMRLFPEMVAVPRIDPGLQRRIAYL